MTHFYSSALESFLTPREGRKDFEEAYAAKVRAQQKEELKTAQGNKA
jgi:hypothetical protein